MGWNFLDRRTVARSLTTVWRLPRWPHGTSAATEKKSAFSDPRLIAIAAAAGCLSGCNQLKIWTRKRLAGCLVRARGNTPATSVLSAILNCDEPSQILTTLLSCTKSRRIEAPQCHESEGRLKSSSKPFTVDFEG